ncbi:MAG: hypothetical protein LBT84_03555 [Spirochaetia bacterium]|nr:hypothetical protein [Spirochaetia bacterium]
MFAKISALSFKKDSAELQKTAAAFLKKFPAGKYAADVSMVLAENEDDPETAVKKYKSLMTKYKTYGRRDLAQLRVCEIYELQGDWKTLANESLAALKNFPQSAYTGDFQLLYCGAETNLYRYNQSSGAANDIIKHEKNKDTNAHAMLFSANAERYRTGYSRSYVYALREILIEYKKHNIYPAAILLMGDFYEKTGNPGKALAAYTDLKTKYPRAPETAMMRDRLAALEEKGTKPEEYIPDKNTIDKSQKIDLAYRTSAEERENSSYYSVSVGPLDSEKRAAEIHKILRKFGAVKTVRRNDGFYHYAGRFGTAQDALGAKIRIAEEYGINGNIVRFAGDENQRYIYGEEK